MFMEPCQVQSALSVILADFERAGVKYGVSEVPTSLYDLRLTQLTVTEQSSGTAIKSVQNTPPVASTSVDTSKVLDEKPKKEPFNPEEYVWKSERVESPLLLIFPTDLDKKDSPLSTKEQVLFDKMMASIGVTQEGYNWVVVRDINKKNRPHTQAQQEKLKSFIEEEVQKLSEITHILIVGQEVCRILMGDNLTSVRKHKVDISGKEGHVVCHPRLLLSQPALKRMAWQDLLKFKKLIGV